MPTSLVQWPSQGASAHRRWTFLQSVIRLLPAQHVCDDLCPIHTADADETKLSSRVTSAVCTRIRNLLATVSSCRRCEHTRRQSWPIGCSIVNSVTADGCVVRPHCWIRRQSSRIHVHTADTDATKQFRRVGGVYWALETGTVRDRNDKSI